MKRILLFFLVILFPVVLFANIDIYYIDVGDADFELIICDGHAMVIDGGRQKADGGRVYSVLGKYVPSGKIDYYIGSHVHEDHMGAAASVLQYIENKGKTVGKIYCPNNDSTLKYFTDFLTRAKKQGVEPKCPELGSVFYLGGARVKVLGPFNRFDTKNPNNTSIVLMITYGSTSFLFMGDAEYGEEKGLIGKWGKELKCDVIKVGHHGSDTSTGEELLQYAAPQYAVISVGTKYGNPDEEVLNRLEEAEVEIYRTDQDGDIHFSSNGKTITIDTQKHRN